MAKLMKAEIEANTAASILAATTNDFADLDRYWPKSKRGSNAQRAFDLLKERIQTASGCIEDVRCALSDQGGE